MFISVLRRIKVCEAMIMIRKHDQAFHITCYEHAWAITDKKLLPLHFKFKGVFCLNRPSICCLYQGQRLCLGSPNKVGLPLILKKPIKRAKLIMKSKIRCEHTGKSDKETYSVFCQIFLQSLDMTVKFKQKARVHIIKQPWSRCGSNHHGSTIVWVPLSLVRQSDKLSTLCKIPFLPLWLAPGFIQSFPSPSLGFPKKCSLVLWGAFFQWSRSPE